MNHKITVTSSPSSPSSVGSTIRRSTDRLVFNPAFNVLKPKSTMTLYTTGRVYSLQLNLDFDDDLKGFTRRIYLRDLNDITAWTESQFSSDEVHTTFYLKSSLGSFRVTSPDVANWLKALLPPFDLREWSEPVYHFAV